MVAKWGEVVVMKDDIGEKISLIRDDNIKVCSSDPFGIYANKDCIKKEEALKKDDKTTEDARLGIGNDSDKSLPSKGEVISNKKADVSEDVNQHTKGSLIQSSPSAGIMRPKHNSRTIYVVTTLAEAVSEATTTIIFDEAMVFFQIRWVFLYLLFNKRLRMVTIMSHYLILIVYTFDPNVNIDEIRDTFNTGEARGDVIFIRDFNEVKIDSELFESQFSQLVDFFVLPSYILVNGSTTNEFLVQQGFKTRGPSIAFFFSFSPWKAYISHLKVAIELNAFRGIQIGDGGKEVSHFFYADEVFGTAFLGKVTNFLIASGSHLLVKSFLPKALTDSQAFKAYQKFDQASLSLEQ
ncbi:hypothetical protein Tco_1419311 [Tanacetum coccineum]